MKNLIINLLVVLGLMACDSSSSVQQTAENEINQLLNTNDGIDRTVVPSPGPAPQINLPEYQTFSLDNGLKVYVVENNKLPRVSISLELKTPPMAEGEKAGLSEIVGELIGRSTTNRTKFELDDEIDFIGATFQTYSNGIYGASLVKHMPKLVEIMTDVLYNASFDPTELEKLKTQYKSNIKAESEEPNSIVANVRRKVIYGEGHPYGDIMTEESIDAITVEDCKKYFKEVFAPGNAYLSIVGDVSIDDAELLANEQFSQWEPNGQVREMNFPLHKVEQTKVAFVDIPSSVQSAIQVAYALDYSLKSEDYLAASIMNEILGGGFSSRLMQNLREDKAFTYGTGSRMADSKYTGNFRVGASVRNEVTDSAIAEILFELNRIVNEGVTEKELYAARASQIGHFARSLEDARTISDFAVNTAVYDLPKDFYATYLKRLSAVTVEEVNAAAKKYIKPSNAYIVVVGKASEVANKLKKFGPVEYFNLEGLQVEDPTITQKVEISADEVYNKYFEALGGVENMKKVKTMTAEMSTELMGSPASFFDYFEAPNKRRVEIVIGGSTVMSRVSNGTDISISEMGSKRILEGDDKFNESVDLYLFPELAYKELNIKSEVIGIRKIDGREMYELEIEYPNGKKISKFYSVKDGLKYREISSEEMEGQVMTETKDIVSYEMIEGVNFPSSVNVTSGPIALEIKKEKLEINPVLPSDIFRIVK